MAWKFWMRFAPEFLGIKVKKVALRPLDIFPFRWKSRNNSSKLSFTISQHFWKKGKPSGPGFLSIAIEKTTSLISSNENVLSSDEAFSWERDLLTHSVNQALLYRFFEYNLKKWIISASILSKSLHSIPLMIRMKSDFCSYGCWVKEFGVIISVSQPVNSGFLTPINFLLYCYFKFSCSLISLNPMVLRKTYHGFFCIQFLNLLD